MKYISFRDGTPNSVNNVLIDVLQNSPHRAMNIAEMRRRVALADNIKNSGNGHIVLSADDHKMLVEALETFPWAVANSALVNMIDDIYAAQDCAEESHE